MPAPSIQTQPAPQCYLCGSAGQLTYAGLKDRLFQASGLWNTQQCLNPECRLYWLDPVPVAADIPKLYQGYYTQDSYNQALAQEEQWKDRLRRWFPAIKSILARLVGVRLEKQRLQDLCLSDLPPGKLLDIGCGAGEFLARMQQRGWQSYGIDVNAQSAADVTARYGIPVHVGDIFSSGFADQTFDAITLSHVIEHLLDPVAVLQECHRLLKPGGMLVMVTPNSASLAHCHFHEHWLALDPPRHLYVFSPQTLTELSQRAGFVTQEVWTSFVYVFTIWAGSLGIQRSQRFRLGKIPPLRDTMAALGRYVVCNWQRQEHALEGDDLVLVAQKP